MEIKINLLEIQPPINNLSTKIYLNKDIGIQLKYPTLENFKSVRSLIFSQDPEQIEEFIFDCTEYVFDDSTVYYSNESSLEEFKQFLGSLTQEQFDKIIDFFKDLPSLRKEVNHKCEKCAFEHNLVLEGLNDFFT